MQTDRQFHLCGPQPAYGLRQFARCSPAIWRGEHVGEDALLALSHAGASTIVDLREEVDERKAYTKARMAMLHYIRIPIRDHHAFTDPQAEQWLALARDPVLAPLYVHCAAGIGRTGEAVALWRVACCGWSAKAAEAESNLFHPYVLGVEVPLVGGMERLQVEHLRAYCTRHGYPLGESE